MSQHDACPRIAVASLAYDGSSIFLQAQNGIALKIEGKIVSSIRLHQADFKIDVIGTFPSHPALPFTRMYPQGEPTLSLLPFNCTPDEHIYQYKATFLSFFSTSYFGGCLLAADFIFAPDECTIENGIILRYVTVVSIPDQENNRARIIGRHMPPPQDFNEDERIGDQGPGIYVCPAEESSILMDPPAPMPVFTDQGPGEYIGRGEDANWPDREPGAAPSNESTVANTESDFDTESMPDTASVGGRPQEPETYEVRMTPLRHDN